MKDSEILKILQKLIERDEKCLRCPRRMSEWYGCESPECPIPDVLQAKYQVSF